MKKQELLKRWRGLKPNQSLEPQPIMYKHTGSTFDEDGIRITGSREFIDTVLSRLKDLLAFEGATTRLQCSYQQATDKATGLPLPSYKCYIQVCMRGRESAMVNLFLQEQGD